MSWLSENTTQVVITDTGKRGTDSASAEETDLANSGSSITLNDVEVSFTMQALLSDANSMNKYVDGNQNKMYDYAEVDHAGIMNPVWTIKGVLDITSSTDMEAVKQLIQLVRTKGYKTLGGTLPDWVDGLNNSSTVNVRVKEFRPKMSSKGSVMNYDLVLVQTG